MYHSSRMRSSHHFEKYESVSGCRLFHKGDESNRRHDFPKIPPKHPQNRTNDGQVKFPPVRGATKNLKPTLAYPPGISNKSNKKGLPMKSSLSMSYSEFQRLLQRQKTSRQYEKFSFTKAYHLPNGIKGYVPASYPEEYYTPRIKFQPNDYAIYNNPYIQEQLRLQHEKAEGNGVGDTLPPLKHEMAAEDGRQDRAVIEALLADGPWRGDFDQVETMMDDERFKDEHTEANPGTENPDEGIARVEMDVSGDIVENQNDVREVENDGGYQSTGPNHQVDVDHDGELDASSFISGGDRLEEIDNHVNESVDKVVAPAAADSAEQNGGDGPHESTDTGLAEQDLTAESEPLGERGGDETNTDSSGIDVTSGEREDNNDTVIEAKEETKETDDIHDTSDNADRVGSAAKQEEAAPHNEEVNLLTDDAPTPRDDGVVTDGEVSVEGAEKAGENAVDADGIGTRELIDGVEGHKDDDVEDDKL